MNRLSSLRKELSDGSACTPVKKTSRASTGVWIAVGVVAVALAGVYVRTSVLRRPLPPPSSSGDYDPLFQPLAP